VIDCKLSFGRTHQKQERKTPNVSKLGLFLGQFSPMRLMWSFKEMTTNRIKPRKAQKEKIPDLKNLAKIKTVRVLIVNKPRLDQLIYPL
jgi:hypothetical protein